MLIRCVTSRFARDERGSNTIEFVVLFFAFIATVMFVTEIVIYQFFAASLEKSAQAGVRAAVVSPILVNAAGSETWDCGDNNPPAVPYRNCKRSNTNQDTFVYGTNCDDASDPCIPFATQTCVLNACANAAAAARVVGHMRRFNNNVQAENITVTYTFVGLGYAGGPVAPLVTVSVEGVAFQTGIVSLLLGDASPLAFLPAKSVSMTGEDLAS